MPPSDRLPVESWPVTSKGPVPLGVPIELPPPPTELRYASGVPEDQQDIPLGEFYVDGPDEVYGASGMEDEIVEVALTPPKRTKKAKRDRKPRHKQPVSEIQKPKRPRGRPKGSRKKRTEKTKNGEGVDTLLSATSAVIDTLEDLQKTLADEAEMGMDDI